jgi:hypothetical protein
MARVQPPNRPHPKPAAARNSLALAAFLACALPFGAAQAAESIQWDTDSDVGCDPALVQAQKAAAQAATEALINRMNNQIKSPEEMAKDCLNDIMNSGVNDSIGISLPSLGNLKKYIMNKVCSMAKDQVNQYLGTGGSYQLDPVSRIPLPNGWSIPKDNYSINSNGASGGTPTINSPYGSGQPLPSTGGGYGDVLKGVFK